MTAGAYYSLKTLDNDGNIALELACSDMSCRDCMSVRVKFDTQPPSCTVASMVSRESFVIQKWTPNACVGGNLLEIASNDYVAGLVCFVFVQV